MCKIFAMTNMEKVELTQKFVGIVRDQVCKLSDKDGFGYAVLGQNGALGGERSMRPHNFKALTDNPGNKIVNKLPIVLKSSNIFGKIDMINPRSFIAHGRLSTNNISLENTHPFTNGEVALIHNGVVYDEGGEVKDSLTTTCDSEILLRYWERGGMKAIEENASGYYAIALLDKKGRMHVARDDRAMLYVSYVRTVHTYMIATTADIIRGVCKKMKWKFEEPEEMVEKTYAVFEGNEIVAHRAIEPMEGMFSVNSLKANAALGYYDETDAEKEPSPSYRELMEKDDYYTGKNSGTASYPPVVSVVPNEMQETRGLQPDLSNDDGPDLETDDKANDDEEFNEEESLVDCVDAFDQIANRHRYTA